MGKALLIARLALKDIRHRPAQSILLLLAIATGAATLALALALGGTTADPYERTRAATNGPDVVAEVSPDLDTRLWAAPARSRAAEARPRATWRIPARSFLSNTARAWWRPPARSR